MRTTVERVKMMLINSEVNVTFCLEAMNIALQLLWSKKKQQLTWKIFSLTSQTSSIMFDMYAYWEKLIFVGSESQLKSSSIWDKEKRKNLVSSYVHFNEKKNIQ